MTIQWGDGYEKVMLDAILAKRVPDGWTLRQWKSATLAPVAGSTLADFTAAGVESSYPGYAAVSLTGAGFAFPPAATDGAGKASSQMGAAASFICAGGGASEDVHGWFISDNVGGGRLVMWEVDAGGPRVMANLGDKITVQPLVKLNDPGTPP